MHMSPDCPSASRTHTGTFTRPLAIPTDTTRIFITGTRTEAARVILAAVVSTLLPGLFVLPAYWD